MRVTPFAAKVTEAALLMGQASVGFLFFDKPALWYRYFAMSSLVLLLGSLTASGVFQAAVSLLAKLFPRRVRLIQDPEKSSFKPQPTLWVKECTDTIFGFAWVVGAMAACPLYLSLEGHETALRSTIDDCVPTPMLRVLVGGGSLLWPAQVAAYLTKAVIGLLVADAYNYWKHRWFHHPTLWAFHKTHHSHHNPSALGGFAISPMFGFATFLPVYAFCLPSLGLYLPLHWPILVFYVVLNMYLHCGYVIEPFEGLGAIGVMTSGWHNAHHEKGRVGFDYKPQTFGEMLTLWDRICGTYADGRYLQSGKPKSKTSKAA